VQSGDLNPKQRAFVDEYLVDLNATQAAIRAGYAPRSARQHATRLLANDVISTAIAEGQAKRSERTQITADRVLEELAAVAFAHMGQYAVWGGEKVRLRESDEVDPRAVAEVKQTVNQFGNNVGIKLHDKLGALAKLGDHLGLWKKDPEQQGDPLRIVIIEDE
jgi:phage terminase small subunit